MSGAQSPGEPRLPPPAELEGMEVRDKTGASVGRVEDIYVAREGGATRYVALASQTSGEVHPVPAGMVRVDEGSGCLVADCSDEELRAGPTVAYEEGMNRPAEERVEAYFSDLHGAGYMRPENEPPEVHGAGYMRPGTEPPEVHGSGYMRPENEPPEVHGAGYMRPENEPPEVHGAGYMRPENEPPEVGGAGRMDPKFLATVRRWRDR